MHIIFARYLISKKEEDQTFPKHADSYTEETVVKKAKELTFQLKQSFTKIDQVFVSPDESGKLFASTVSNDLGKKPETFVYLKRFNRFGLLSGLDESTALEKYQNLLSSLKSEEYIAGSERFDDFIKRVQELLVELSSTKKTELDTTLCFIDSNMLTIIIEEMLGKIRNEIDEVAYLYCDLEGNQLKLADTYGITFIKTQT